jgi:hypothetical protein
MLARDLKGSGLEDYYNSNYQTNNDIKDSHLEDAISNSSNGYENPCDEMNKAILAELNDSDNLKGINIEELTEEERHNLLTPQQRETIRKIRDLEDDDYINNNENVF